MIARRFAPALALLVAIASAAGPAAAQQRDWSQVEIQVQEVGDGVWMMTGAGGNLGVSAGEDGVFLVDDQYAPLTGKIRAAVAELGHGEVRFVINTHWHGDHTGGNENFGEAGAVLVAHDNVRERMSVAQFSERWGETPASPKGALPVVTFADSVTFHLNGDTIHVFHVPPAHTDGDSIIHFQQADVIHMGDVFFAGGYPFVDLESGGSVEGVIAAADRVLELAGAGTKIIPGHGALTDAAGLKEYRDMIAGVVAAVRPMMEEGKSLEEIQAAKPSAPWDEAWGGGWIDAPTFVEAVFKSLSE
jgi:glyoxylase-like metal-dependent hydrolase (beta-lactamase superfamily II)